MRPTQLEKTVLVFLSRQKNFSVNRNAAVSLPESFKLNRNPYNLQVLIAELWFRNSFGFGRGIQFDFGNPDLYRTGLHERFVRFAIAEHPTSTVLFTKNINYDKKGFHDVDNLSII